MSPVIIARRRVDFYRPTVSRLYGTPITEALVTVYQDRVVITAGNTTRNGRFCPAFASDWETLTEVRTFGDPDLDDDENRALDHEPEWRKIFNVRQKKWNKTMFRELLECAFIDLYDEAARQIEAHYERQWRAAVKRVNQTRQVIGQCPWIEWEPTSELTRPVAAVQFIDLAADDDAA